MTGSNIRNGPNKIGLYVPMKLYIIVAKKAIIICLFISESVSNNTILFLGKPPPNSLSNFTYPLLMYVPLEIGPSFCCLFLDIFDLVLIMNSVDWKGEQ